MTAHRRKATESKNSEQLGRALQDEKMLVVAGSSFKRPLRPLGKETVDSQERKRRPVRVELQEMPAAWTAKEKRDTNDMFWWQCQHKLPGNGIQG